ncbi:hypothetical protein K443DRAFT_34820, partial [Laccaria amethystina LaAM-08-1]
PPTSSTPPSMASRTRAKDTKTRSRTIQSTPPSRKRGPLNAGEQQNKHQKKRQADPGEQMEDTEEKGAEEESRVAKKARKKGTKKPRAKKQRYAPPKTSAARAAEDVAEGVPTKLMP